MSGYNKLMSEYITSRLSSLSVYAILVQSGVEINFFMCHLMSGCDILMSA